MTVLRETASEASVEQLRQRSWQRMAGGASNARWLRGAVRSLLARSDLNVRALGPVIMADATVVPIVVFDDQVLSDRANAGLAPAVDRLALRQRLERTDWEATSPIHQASFVGVWGRTNLTSLARLGGYGQVILLLPPNEAPATLNLAECDWRGIGVATTGDDGVGRDIRWLLTPAQVSPVRQTNMRFEQLVDLALSTR